MCPYTHYLAKLGAGTLVNEDVHRKSVAAEHSGSVQGEVMHGV